MTIAERREAILKKISELREQLEIAYKLLEALQEQCPHEVTEYNWGSCAGYRMCWTKCVACGKILSSYSPDQEKDLDD